MPNMWSRSLFTNCRNRLYTYNMRTKRLNHPTSLQLWKSTKCPGQPDCIGQPCRSSKCPCDFGLEHWCRWLASKLEDKVTNDVPFGSIDLTHNPTWTFVFWKEIYMNTWNTIYCTCRMIKVLTYSKLIHILCLHGLKHHSLSLSLCRAWLLAVWQGRPLKHQL